MKAPLGSIPELPADSCKEIISSEGKVNNISKYWLDPHGNGTSVLVYCDMNLEGNTDSKLSCQLCVSLKIKNLIYSSQLAWGKQGERWGGGGGERESVRMRHYAPGGDSHMKQTGMLAGNFEFNP